MCDRRQRQHARTDVRQQKPKPAAFEVIDQHHVLRRRSHVFEKLHGLRFIEVMQKKRADNHIRFTRKIAVQRVPLEEID